MARHCACAAMANVSLFPPRHWRGGFPRRLPEEAWRIVPWREGSNEILSSRFAAVRIRPASRDWKVSTPHPLEWLFIAWPEGEKERTKYWLSTLPEDTPDVLVDTAKLRWRIERDNEELKSDLGLAHFEGRSWRGFHHHATLCIDRESNFAGLVIRQATAKRRPVSFDPRQESLSFQ
jgi:SRSO17 transposase